MEYTYSDGTIKQTPVAIDGRPLPCPSGMEIGEEDLHGNAERSAAGYLVADLIRAGVRKLSLKWSYLPAQDYAQLKARLGAGMWKSVTYLTESGTTRTITCYKGAISATPHRLLASGVIDGYLNVSVNLIER